jgi:hypothetical protein
MAKMRVKVDLGCWVGPHCWVRPEGAGGTVLGQAQSQNGPHRMGSRSGAQKIRTRLGAHRREGTRSAAMEGGGAVGGGGASFVSPIRWRTSARNSRRIRSARRARTLSMACRIRGAPGRCGSSRSGREWAGDAWTQWPHAAPRRSRSNAGAGGVSWGTSGEQEQMAAPWQGREGMV